MYNKIIMLLLYVTFMLFLFHLNIVICDSSDDNSNTRRSNSANSNNNINNMIHTKKLSPEVELQTCIDNFDIHKDKIIRTQDSRDMGAKYLNEIDLGSREECLRLCCETDTCDVFVFEEKSPGSCYLFHCGPSEDFRCKFTRHVNYSSAVLTINRHNDLENEIKMTKHEEDLTRLRKPDNLGFPVQTPQRTTSKPSTTVSSTSVEPSLDKNFLLSSFNTAKGSGCSRYQFECRSTLECIAIYNACDGIPQCADGSDEAPELGCPATTTGFPAIVSPTFSPLIVSQQFSNINKVQIPSQDYQDQTNIPKYISPQVKTPNILVKEPIVVNSHDQNAGAYLHQDRNIPNRVLANKNLLQQMPSSRISPLTAISSSTYNDAAGMNNYPMRTQILPQSWIPHQSNEMPESLIPLGQNQYNEPSSHIFNHKVNSIQVGDTAESQSGGIRYDDFSRNFPKLMDYYNNDLYRQQMQIPELWHQQLPNEQGQMANFFLPKQGITQNWAQNLKNSKASNDETINNQQKENNISKTIKPDEKEKIKENITVENNVKENKTQESATKKTNKTTHQHNSQNVHLQPSASLKTFDDSISIVEIDESIINKPSGAILSLILGLCITVVMVVIIGCRLRVVRKRLRRGGKSPYTHDADYLVNGMYL